MIGVAGSHLYLSDRFRDTARPLLAVMADPTTVFFRGLRRFRRLIAYGNVLNDRTVLWYSAAFATTDPYADLSKVAVRYVKGYEGVVLEQDDGSGGGVVLRNVKKMKQKTNNNNNNINTSRPNDNDVESRREDWPDDADSQTATDLSWDLRLKLVGMGVVLLTLLPILIPILGVGTSAAMTLSRRRMQRHDQGEDGIPTETYRRLPIWATGTKPDNDTDNDISNDTSNETTTSTTATTTTTTITAADGLATSSSSLADAFPALILSPVQREMARNLSTLPWRRFPVLIRMYLNTHVDVIVRDFGVQGTDGRVVLRHFVDEEFLA